jgi:hypothetical protein
MSRTILDVAPLLMLNVALTADVSHAARLLWMLVLVDEAIETKEGMARRLGIGLRQVERALSELEGAGLVKRHARWQVGLSGHGAVWTAVVPGADEVKNVVADPGGDTQPIQPLPSRPRHRDNRQVDLESLIGAASTPDPFVNDRCVQCGHDAWEHGPNGCEARLGVMANTTQQRCMCDVAREGAASLVVEGGGVDVVAGADVLGSARPAGWVVADDVPGPIGGDAALFVEWAALYDAQHGFVGYDNNYDNPFPWVDDVENGACLWPDADQAARVLAVLLDSESLPESVSVVIVTMPMKGGAR